MPQQLPKELSFRPVIEKIVNILVTKTTPTPKIDMLFRGDMGVFK